ncbi:MAG: hypothetical protein A2Z32_01630 [Chloroflexi bacterium RBG_16_69_14]|nr:MAG: hypothetical protein A2Z32_01630 [Chloroflexi bacterium RBG_16_69_14]
MTISIAAQDAALDLRLMEVLPEGWTVVNAQGGAVSPDGGTVQWTLGDIGADASLDRRLTLRAPDAVPGAPVADARFAVRLDHSTGTIAGPDLELRVAPELVVEHVTFARIAPVTHQALYEAQDAPLLGVQPLDSLRVRLQVRNADLVAAALEPWLEIRAIGSAAWQPLATESEVGAPFYLGTEWRPAPGGRGTIVGPAEEAIAVGDLRTRDRDDPTQTALAGRRLMGRQTSPRLTIPGDAYTEVEFTVRATIDAPYASAYELRLTDAGDPLPGAVTARLSVGSRLPLRLSPGQRDGVPVPGPDEATAPAAWSAVDHPLVTPDAIRATIATAPAEPRYRLAVATVPTPPVEFPLAAPGDSPHGPDMSLVSDTCAACHRGHTAAGPNLLAQPMPQSTLCFTCHGGVGSSLDVKSQYTDPAVPANDAATRSNYRHDALAPSNHVSATVDEFGGISNRHSECGDCHNSHIATSTLSSQTATGWTVSGRQTSISGVAVTNSAAGTAPTYTLLTGEAGSQPTREYEVCFKCHSGWTVLPSNAGQPPSRQALDKAIEFNPSNASYHPVEAAGTNTTQAMTDSLVGTSPYKQWNFTTSSTVRCVNCHGDPRKYDATTPPAAGADLAPHTSEYRGLLLQDYRDRVLKSSIEGYAAADFALCYLCHAEEPFLNQSSSATNFRLHREHVDGLAGAGSGGIDIDTAGAGQGNAVCAECHFRIHSTALRVAPQDAYPRLINFAPNVQPLGGTLSWESRAGGGSCTLVCHGKDHNGTNY